MSDIGNIGGSRGIQPTILDQNVGGTGKVGDLGGHAVTQAQTAQTPAKGSGIGDKIANFFTSTLPKFFSSVGESISNFFSRLTAPAQQPTPQTTTQTTGTAQTPQVGNAQPSAPKTVGEYYDVLAGIISKAPLDTLEGTFLRGPESPNKYGIKQEFKPFAQSWGQSVLSSLPQDSTVAFRLQNYEGGEDIFKSMEGSEGRLLGTSSFPKLVDAGKAGESMKVIQDCWDKLFGSDPQSSKQIATGLPDEVKNYIASGLKAIDDSHIPDDVKGKLKDTFLSDVVLRCISPALTDLSVQQRDNPNAKASLIEITKFMTTICNGLDPTKVQKEPVFPGFVEAFGDRYDSMRGSMLDMLREAGRQGTPYTPPDTGSDNGLILTMDDVKQLTTPTPTPLTSIPDYLTVSPFDDTKDTNGTKL